MADEAKAFEVEEQGDTLVVVPTSNMSEFEYAQLDAEAKDVQKMLDAKSGSQLVVDLANTDHIGSLSIGIFVKLWKNVSSRDGRMAVCGASDFEQEVLKLAKLDRLWKIVATRDEAFAAVKA